MKAACSTSHIGISHERLIIPSPISLYPPAACSQARPLYFTFTGSLCSNVDKRGQPNNYQSSASGLHACRRRHRPAMNKNNIFTQYTDQMHRPASPAAMSTVQTRASAATYNTGQQQQASTVDHRELPAGLDADRLPRHVSVIMDGNARWAQMQGVERPKGHAAGVKALMELIFLSSEWGLSAFSVFLFSTENWKRSQDEVSALMEIYEKNLIDHLANFLKYNMKVKVIGDKEQLPQSFQNTIFEVEKKTGQNTGMKVAFAINYGGRLDIMQAFQQVATKLQQGRIKLEDVSEEAIDNELWTSWMEDTQAPDLLIRTSGEQRISNFFLWQAAYSEIMFLDVCFPALNQAIYSKALVDFQKRNRRYGKRQPIQLEK